MLQFLTSYFSWIPKALKIDFVPKGEGYAKDNKPYCHNRELSLFLQFLCYKLCCSWSFES